MTTLREAAQQALEALEDFRFAAGFDRPLAQDAIDALRAALAQQAEPVAWLQPKTVDAQARPDLGYETCSKDDYGAFPVYRASPKAEPEQGPVAWMFTDREGTEFFEQREDWDGWWTPLYTAPPQRKPLTEEEIRRICDAHWSLRQLVRAVERAHGIVTCGDTKERA